MKVQKLAALPFVFASLMVQAAPFCTNWTGGEKSGEIDIQRVTESSGLSDSVLPDRLYHHNDSGSGTSFYVSKRDGSQTKAVDINDVTMQDMEDMSYGACPGKPAKNCLYFADIGNNKLKDKDIPIAIIEEEASFGSQVTPYRVVWISYPDGPHNAEAMAVHPDGSLYIFTKEKKKNTFSRIYRLASNQMKGGDDVQELQFVGQLDFSDFAAQEKGAATITSADISTDGKRVLLLSYGNAYELNIDLSTEFTSTESLIQQKRFTEIVLPHKDQQEAITYLADDSILYSLEGESTMYRLSCRP